jgi:hypothetical protein
MLLALAPAGEPHLELVTMGQGPEILQRYGHAALCVVWDRDPDRSTCYNYGATNFDSPPQQLAWSFLRGTSEFWVATIDRQLMLEVYRSDDRSVWIQRLPLGPAQVAEMRRRLEHDAKEENRTYLYHHFDDNCTTRLRDHIDAVTGGALRRGSGRGTGVSYRELGRRGIAEQTRLVMLAAVLVGRRIDREATEWGAMFHPDFLRAAVHERLGAPPLAVHRRQGPPFSPAGSHGTGWFFLLALALALPAVAAPWLGRADRVLLALPALVLTLIALAVWTVVSVSKVPELRWNEALLVFWPTDLLLVILGEARRRQYARIRVVVLAAVSLLATAGLIRHTLLAPLLLAALPFLVVVLHPARRAVPAPSVPRAPAAAGPPDA